MGSDNNESSYKRIEGVFLGLSNFIKVNDYEFEIEDRVKLLQACVLLGEVANRRGQTEGRKADD